MIYRQMVGKRNICQGFAMAVPLRLSRLRVDNKGKRVAEIYGANGEGASAKSNAKSIKSAGVVSLENWRETLPEETRNGGTQKLFGLTCIGVADDDVYKAALAVEDEVFTDATNLSDYKTRMAAKYDAVTPTVVCGPSKAKEAAQRIFLTAQTFFDDDNFRYLLDPPQPEDTSETRETALKLEKQCIVTHANFSSIFGHPCGLLPGHRRLAKATHSALVDFFGRRLEPRADAFNAHFKASNANRKIAIGHGLNSQGHVQSNLELADVDKAIESYYFT
ncbi:unnamed protein product [Calypogeia fissa]